MRNLLYLFFLFCLLSCGDSPIKTKHNTRYLAIQKKVVEFRPQINGAKLGNSRREAFEVKKILDIFEVSDIDDFVRRIKIDEATLVVFLDTYDEFTDRIKESQNLFINSYERQVYSNLRTKALADAAIIKPYLKKNKNRVGSDEYFIKTFLKNLFEFDKPEDLVAEMMITGVEFNARLLEFNNQWEDIIELIVEMEQAD